MLYRKIEKTLKLYYKDDNYSRIMIVTGARQIGKSFIIRETAKKAFNHYIEINLQEDSLKEKHFANCNSVDSFYMQLSALYGNNLGDIKDTIIFLDEIQTYPNLITLLKYLKEDGKYRYIASGSLLGITLKHIFIPIGYIEEYKMYPMDFEEFLIATGCGVNVIEYLKKCFENLLIVDDGIHSTLLHRFKEYLICGGLPAAVEEFIIRKNIGICRNIQSSIFQYYKDDASRYSLNNKLKINRIYDDMQSYMENKVKRINFKKIENIENANLVKYQDEFDYLISSGCTLHVKAISNPIFPINESSSKNLIKLYYNDVGILSNILYKNNINAILEEDKGINLGSIYETAIAMELKAHGHELYYFDSKKVGEVDFLVNDYNSLSVCGIEVKSGNNQNNYRALPKLVKNPYNMKIGYVLGNKNIVSKNDNIITLPIYMIMFI